jgi:chaperone modulatory protein CbpM
MNVEIAAATFLEEDDVVTFVQLVERSGLAESELRELVECGAFSPADASAWTFSSQAVVVARTAYRLREEFALDDMHALAIVLRLVQRIETLEAQLRRHVIGK